MDDNSLALLHRLDSSLHALQVSANSKVTDGGLLMLRMLPKWVITCELMWPEYTSWSIDTKSTCSNFKSTHSKSSHSWVKLCHIWSTPPHTCTKDMIWRRIILSAWGIKHLEWVDLWPLYPALLALYILKMVSVFSLKTLHLKDLPSVKNKQQCLELLQKALPDCEIVYMDVKWPPTGLVQTKDFIITGVLLDIDSQNQIIFYAKTCMSIHVYAIIILSNPS